MRASAELSEDRRAVTVCIIGLHLFQSGALASATVSACNLRDVLEGLKMIERHSRQIRVAFLLIHLYHLKSGNMQYLAYSQPPTSVAEAHKADFLEPGVDSVVQM